MRHVALVERHVRRVRRRKPFVFFGHEVRQHRLEARRVEPVRLDELPRVFGGRGFLRAEHYPLVAVLVCREHQGFADDFRPVVRSDRESAFEHAEVAMTGVVLQGWQSGFPIAVPALLEPASPG